MLRHAAAACLEDRSHVPPSISMPGRMLRSCLPCLVVDFIPTSIQLPFRGGAPSSVRMSCRDGDAKWEIYAVALALAMAVDMPWQQM
ncbi:hypothetical protein CCR84_14540 [Rhodocyclus purpureus]|nr:hypothetical protein [Rhodocyclus purpureus]